MECLSMQKNSIIKNNIVNGVLFLFSAFLFLCSVFLFVKLMTTNQKIEKLKNDYFRLSRNVTKLNTDLILRYANEVDKTRDEQIIDEIILQLSPIFDLLVNDKTVSYTDPLIRYEYTKGYIAAWREYIISCHLDADEMTADLLHGNGVMGLPNGDGTFIGHGITYSNASLNQGFSQPMNTKFYAVGKSDGNDSITSLYDKVYIEIATIKGENLEQDFVRLEEFRMVEEKDVKDRILQSPSLQAFIIILKILKHSEKSKPSG
jgi:hypothetical protein